MDKFHTKPALVARMLGGEFTIRAFRNIGCVIDNLCRSRRCSFKRGGASVKNLTGEFVPFIPDEGKKPTWYDFSKVGKGGR